MEYRREIDGLRALAVVPVILFHAGFHAFGGGFVGVDVFFVISGYLITSIILAEKMAGTFTLANFYERRARRILPVLFVVMLFSLVFAWLWLLPADMKSFSQSLVAVSVFSSNVLFWHTSGYFDTAAELKPLLHTWSLAVEEQYYLLFPAFLIMAWKMGRRWILGALALVFVFSLGYAQWSAAHEPAFAFFMLPTRGWELLIGAFIAFHLTRRAALPGSVSTAPAINQAASALGLLLIVYAVFAYDEKTPFPGLYALVPTLGTGLIILFADRQTWVGRALGNRVLVGIGLISYSAYLWHQPLFALARQHSVEEPRPWLMAALVALSAVLAFFSWRYVEKPFRFRKTFSRRQVFGLALIASAFFIAVGLGGQFTRGYGRRLAPDQREFLGYFENDIPEWKFFTRLGIQATYRGQCNFYDMDKYRHGHSTSVPLEKIADECHVRDPSRKNAVFIWGDSHAQNFYPGLKKALPADWQILQVASSGCEAHLDATPNKADYCEYSNWFAFKTIAEVRPDVVLIGQNVHHDATRMKEMGERLKAAGVGKVIFTGPTPHWTADLPKLIVQKLWKDTPHRTHAGVDKQIEQANAQLVSEFVPTPSTSLVDVLHYFCNAEGCMVYVGDSRRDDIVSWDYGHLTPIASYMLARDVLVKEITGAPPPPLPAPAAQ